MPFAPGRSAQIALLLVVGLLAGCGGSEASQVDPSAPPSSAEASASTAATSTEAASTTAAPTSTAPLARSMRGDRYCEVLLVTPKDAGFTARVFNTYGLNDCPGDAWAALVPETIAQANDVPVALLNGPRFWLMDRVEKSDAGDLNKVDFGDIEMNELAIVTVEARLDAVRAYAPSSVERSAVFTYDAGNTVFELTDAAGSTFIMQSWSQQVDPSLTEADLALLGSRLTLPEGWTYSTRVLTEELRLETVDEAAQVLQDDLRNSYSLIPGT